MTDTVGITRSALLWTALVAALLVWALRDLALLVGYSVLLAYALHPLVGALERVPLGRGRTVPRGLAAALVVLALVAVAGWGLALAVPRLVDEAARFAAGAPGTVERLAASLSAWAATNRLGPWLDPAIESLHTNATGLLQNLGGALAHGLGRLFGSLGRVLGLALVPLLAFYLLADARAVQASALRFVPEQARADVQRLGGATDRALRSYVRGQATVCLVMGGAVGLGLTLLHYPVALLLGVVAGLAEVVPYLGFAVAALSIGLTGLSASPLVAALGLLAYIAINWTIGTFVTPRVMGRWLKMHPFVVTVSVLAGARLLGPAGALLALPGAAMIQAVVAELAPAAGGRAEAG